MRWWLNMWPGLWRRRHPVLDVLVPLPHDLQVQRQHQRRALGGAGRRDGPDLRRLPHGLPNCSRAAAAPPHVRHDHRGGIRDGPSKGRGNGILVGRWLQQDRALRRLGFDRLVGRHLLRQTPYLPLQFSLTCGGPRAAASPYICK